MLWFGVLAAPLAWSAHELLSYGLASFLCDLKPGAIGAQMHALSLPFVIATCLMLALALAGAWTALRNWRAVPSNPDPSDIGAERSRFLAHCGLINSVVFLTAFCFTIAEMVFAPLCGR